MDAKSLLSEVRSNTAIPSIRITRKPLYSTLSPPNCSFVLQSHKRSIIFRHRPSISLGARERNKIIACDNNAVEKVMGGVDSQKGIGNQVRRKKLVVFVSGGGSNFRSIYEACLQGSVLGDIVALVTNNQGCGGAEFAREKGIAVMVFPRTKVEPNGLSPTDLVVALREFQVDFVLLAGYLKLIPVELVRAYPKSILNIHLSLLPAFGGKGYYGMKVHKAVIASEARFSGPTIHFVDEHYDMGRILAQKAVPVLPNDTAEDLAARVLREEHRLYVEVVAALCEDRITWRQDGVPLIRSKQNPNEYR